jgi:small subunit ribosomal protein S16
MVKIRLRRIGGKGHPVYRVVVAESSAGRNGNVVESIGLYDPVAQPKQLEINEERALHWLRLGAQPSETTAFILNKLGILPKFLEERPNQKKNYPFLNKAIAATSAPAPEA